MGWLQLNRNTSAISTSTSSERSNLGRKLASPVPAVNEHSPDGSSERDYPAITDNREDVYLPQIPQSVITARKLAGQHLWLVIDSIVYDCTEFVSDHPGGGTVIESFRGEDCSWQFWRFHAGHHLREYARPLRIGKTTCIANRFTEIPRYVGLRPLGVSDDWSGT